MTSKKWLGITLATTAAAIFTTVPAPIALADTTAVACYGGNACKGQSACQSIRNTCSGENTCKGQGVAMLSPEDCDTVGGDQNPPSSLE